MPREIIVDIEVGGDTKIDAIGFEGKACETATAQIEKLLGRRTGVKRKPEHQHRVTTVRAGS